MGDILDRLDYIKRGVKALDSLISRYEVSEILNDFILLNSVLHIIQTSIQSLLDIGARVISECGLKPPTIYRDIPIFLHENDFLNNHERDLMIKIIGFRNILVHGYLGINLELLKEIISNRKYRDILELAIKITNKAKQMGIDP